MSKDCVYVLERDKIISGLWWRLSLKLSLATDAGQTSSIVIICMCCLYKCVILGMLSILFLFLFLYSSVFEVFISFFCHPRAPLLSVPRICAYRCQSRGMHTLIFLFDNVLFGYNVMFVVFWQTGSQVRVENIPAKRVHTAHITGGVSYNVFIYSVFIWLFDHYFRPVCCSRSTRICT